MINWLNNWLIIAGALSCVAFLHDLIVTITSNRNHVLDTDLSWHLNTLRWFLIDEFILYNILRIRISLSRILSILVGHWKLLHSYSRFYFWYAWFAYWAFHQILTHFAARKGSVKPRSLQPVAGAGSYLCRQYFPSTTSPMPLIASILLLLILFLLDNLRNNVKNAWRVKIKINLFRLLASGTPFWQFHSLFYLSLYSWLQFSISPWLRIMVSELLEILLLSIKILSIIFSFSAYLMEALAIELAATVSLTCLFFRTSSQKVSNSYLDIILQLLSFPSVRLWVEWSVRLNCGHRNGTESTTSNDN